MTLLESKLDQKELKVDFMQAVSPLLDRQAPGLV
jgi:hypothetical protein